MSIGAGGAVPASRDGRGIAYALGMGVSLPAHEFDPGHYGLLQDQLPPSDRGPIDLRGWFGEERRGNPLELEIGSGKGTFLIKQATLVPEVNYIGLEWAKAFWRYAADRARRRGVENARFVRVDAAAFVRSYVATGSLRQVHIYFPDPWPKKRHQKRRLVQAGFLRELHRVLRDAPAEAGEPGMEPGPMVRIATDHADYFAWMEEHAAAVSDVFERLPFESPAAADAGELVGTNFERKYRREGRPFYGMILRKR